MKTGQMLVILLALGMAPACSDDASAKEGMPEDAMEKMTEDVDDAKAAMGEEIEAGKAMIEKEIAGYEATLNEKKKELDALLAKLKGLSPADMLGAEAKNLKADADALEKVIADLMSKIDAAKAKLADLEK